MSQNAQRIDVGYPAWYNGKTLNEALFCEEFLRENKIIFANGAFFTPEGRVANTLSLRGEIYNKLRSYVESNIAKKISNILEVMKLEAQVENFPLDLDRIHVSNGTLLLDGTFTEGKPEIVRCRLPVAYQPDAPPP